MLKKTKIEINCVIFIMKTNKTSIHIEFIKYIKYIKNFGGQFQIILQK